MKKCFGRASHQDGAIGKLDWLIGWLTNWLNVNKRASEINWSFDCPLEIRQEAHFVKI